MLVEKAMFQMGKMYLLRSPSQITDQGEHHESASGEHLSRLRSASPGPPALDLSIPWERSPTAPWNRFIATGTAT